MKFLIVFVAVAAFFHGVQSECDEAAIKNLRECYRVFLTKTGLTKSPDTLELPATFPKPTTGDDKFCEIFHEQQKCIDDGSKECRNSKGYEKAFKVPRNDLIVFVFMELTNKFMCSVKHEMTKEDIECFSSFTREDIKKECRSPPTCNDFDDYLDCNEKLMNKKCGNEKLAKIYSDAMRKAFKQMIPKCS